MAKICVHRAQICGLAWSPDGAFFATGANDNLCLLFEARDVLRRTNASSETKDLSSEQLQFIPHIDQHAINKHYESLPRTSRKQWSEATEIRHKHRDPRATRIYHPSRISYIPGTRVLLIGPGRQKHTFTHSAAVKAIAFCPWQRGLVATRGGVNDRTIRFWHVFSGECLAVIAVHAQVTSLVWSQSRREIAATFGFAQPDHPYRIAVFSWPDCRQIIGIPWAKPDERALFAVAYPGGPNEIRNGQGGRRNQREGGTWSSRTKDEGCIVVAGSDGSIKFHEVWCDGGGHASGAVSCSSGGAGFFARSQILEGLDSPDAGLSARTEWLIR